MKNGTSKITVLQLFFIIVQTQIGVGVLSLPYTVFNVSGTDGWISILLSGFFIQLAIFIIWQLNRSYPNETLYDYTPRVIGKYFGSILNLLYTLFFSITAALVLVLFSNTVKTWAFPLTPSWIIIGFLMGICTYLVVADLVIMARFYVLVSIIILVFVGLVVYAHSEANYLYVFPLGKEGLINMIKGSKEAVISMLGFEMLLVIFPFIKGKDIEKLKMATYSNIFVTMIYTFIAFTSYVFFSPAEIVLVPEPVLYMMKEFSFVILERIDLIFLSFWIIAVGTSVMSYLYLASKGVAKLFSVRKESKVVPYVAFFIFIGSIIPTNHLLIDRLSEIIGNISILFIPIIPLFLLALTFWTKRKRRETG